jgi:hypothetical protein
LAEAVAARGLEDGEALAAGEAAGAAEAEDEGVEVFSPSFINEGSFRNLINQSGSTRAPSLVSIGGRNSF